MLSSTFNLLENSHLGSDPRVSSLLKGVYNLRPPVPRYQSTWDPSVVVNFLKKSANESLSLLGLSKKLATLLALTTLMRGAELSSISLASVRVVGESASFSLAKPRKAQHAGPVQSFTLKAWSEDGCVCPVQCLNAYLVSSGPFRGSDNSSRLFIGVKKPHKPVSSSTVGRWIKALLAEAGVDTGRFSSHSTRGASASKALASGVLLSTILQKGHWAQESTFARFYNRSLVDDSVQAAVLSTASAGASV